MTLSKLGQSLTVLVASLALVACGPAEAVITAELAVDGPDGGTVNRPLADFEVQLLPFDRDQIFDSLTQASPTPEPQIPADILEAQEQVAAAQVEWRETEDRWNTLRDTLQSLSSALEGLNRGESRYRAVFTEWSDLDRQYQQVERQVQGAFENFETLQSAAIERVDSMRFIREDWADQAYEAYDAVVTAKIAASGLDVAADTTDAQGIANFEAGPGQYWLHARHSLPYNELYWNIPVTLARGEPVQLRLSRDNAQVRPIF
ncbi:MAG: hypothetical protein ACR2QM_07320 [Longimicrobiales bacterium]